MKIVQSTATTILYRGVGSSSVPTKNPLGEWYSTRPEVAQKYGTAFSIVLPTAAVYRFQDIALNEAILSVFSAKVDPGNAHEISELIHVSIDEEDRRLVKPFELLRGKGFRAVSVNAEESGVFVFGSQE